MDILGHSNKSSLFYQKKLTLDIELEVLVRLDTLPLEGFVVDRTGLALLLAALVLSHSFVNEDLVLLEFQHDIWITLSKGIFITKMLDLLQNNS